jgi:hypothetical protein
MAQYVHNSWENSTTGYTPFELLIGHTPGVHISHEVTAVPEVDKQQEWLEHVQWQAQAACHAFFCLLYNMTRLDHC